MHVGSPALVADRPSREDDTLTVDVMVVFAAEGDVAALVVGEPGALGGAAVLLDAPLEPAKISDVVDRAVDLEEGGRRPGGLALEVAQPDVVAAFVPGKVVKGDLIGRTGHDVELGVLEIDRLAAVHPDDRGLDGGQRYSGEGEGRDDRQDGAGDAHLEGVVGGFVDVRRGRGAEGSDMGLRGWGVGREWREGRDEMMWDSRKEKDRIFWGGGGDGGF